MPAKVIAKVIAKITTKAITRGLIKGDDETLYNIYKPLAYKLAKKEDLRHSKRTASGNTGRYTTNSGLIANKDDNDAYNRAYIPPAKAEEEEEGSSSNNNSVNSSTSDSADKGEGSGTCERSEGALYYEDIPPYK
ncbi:hypothetical protein P8C59_007425 [Phyllachora maydis]|uniref:Uncharacterized protein n=1 Tax=Phyllachora maydis TaxID=1825666 RepID=A0AAD9I9H8_9PEZI|nr:hypothetical protein P8C59_007425 [Phyllachora maydis]